MAPLIVTLLVALVALDHLIHHHQTQDRRDAAGLRMRVREFVAEVK